MTMDLNFACTMCGNCCHNLRLPLSVNEAIRWLERGGDVQVFCEAMPWPVEPSTDDGQAQHRRIRSFAAESGELAIRVMVTVVAAFDGACPHLQPDMRCGGYEARPNVCRIYPAEINPFIEPMPTHKACPPRQNTCRPDRIHEPGAMMRKRIGKIRTGIQGQSGSAVAAAGERGVGRCCA
jgi:Fe-S-cluster containining protein